MVSVTIGAGREARWVLRPNQSLSWRDAKLFFSAMVAALSAIAVSFTYLGCWPVLPFAGAEVSLLGGALYWCQRRGRQVEIVSVRDGRVAVEKGAVRPERRWDFERAWVQVMLLKPRVAGHPTQLVLRSHGTQVAIGDFLVEEERRRFAGELRSVVSPRS